MSYYRERLYKNRANELTVGLLLIGLDDGKPVGLACKVEVKTI